jgi:hypothetical protein
MQVCGAVAHAHLSCGLNVCAALAVLGYSRGCSCCFWLEGVRDRWRWRVQLLLGDRGACIAGQNVSKFSV